jgi:alanine racemase
MHRRTTATIDLGAIRDNFALACRQAPQSKTMAVIKANAYGHGLLEVAAALRDAAPAFAVATLDEAVVLRAAGVDKDVLVLEGVNSADAYREAEADGLTLAVNSREQVELARGTTTPVWIKVDTGMHRLGIHPDELADVVATLRKSSVAVEVVCTHLARADDLDDPATRHQLEAFRASAEACGLPRSIANSAGILGWPDSHAEWNRPGIMLYGPSPFAARVAAAEELRPAMTFEAEVIALRDIPVGDSVGYGGRWIAARPSRIATLAAGYADGYPRHAPDGTPTFVRGRIAPLAGTVSMDMITIDVTDQPDVAVGDSVELWGRNVPVTEIATRAGTISYELLTRVSSRVPRHYSSGSVT